MRFQNLLIVLISLLVSAANALIVGDAPFDSFTLSVDDGLGGSAVQEFTVNLTGAYDSTTGKWTLSGGGYSVTFTTATSVIEPESEAARAEPSALFGLAPKACASSVPSGSAARSA